MKQKRTLSIPKRIGSVFLFLGNSRRFFAKNWLGAQNSGQDLARLGDLALLQAKVPVIVAMLLKQMIHDRPTMVILYS